MHDAAVNNLGGAPGPTPRLLDRLTGSGRPAVALLLAAALAACSPDSNEGRPAESAQDAPVATSAAGNPARAGYFMNIDDLSIRGESTSVSHRDWIELQSLASGEQRVEVSGSSTSAQVRLAFDGLRVSKSFDRSTPELRRAITEGRIFGEVRIERVTGCGNGLHTQLVITLNTARIVAIEASIGSGDFPGEALQLEFSRIETRVNPVDSSCRPLPPLFSSRDGNLLTL